MLSTVFGSAQFWRGQYIDLIYTYMKPRTVGKLKPPFQALILASHNESLLKEHLTQERHVQRLKSGIVILNNVF